MTKTWPGAAYVVIRIGKPIRDEWTNVGVILFDKDSKQIGSRVVEDLNRAVRRGDIEAENGWMEAIHDLLHEVPTLEEVYHILSSSGHFMSVLQLTDPRPIVLTSSSLDDMYQEFVA